MQPCDPDRVEMFDYSRLSNSFSGLGKPLLHPTRYSAAPASARG